MSDSNNLETVVENISSQFESTITENTVENTTVIEVVSEEKENICEPVNTPITENNEESHEKTFIDLIKSCADSEEFKKKLSFEIPKDVFNIINFIISLTPNTLNDIEKAVREIIKDNKVGSKDIPQFIVIVQRIHQIVYEIRYNKVYKVYSKERGQLTAFVFKFLIHVLVLEKKIQIDEALQEEFLNDFNFLIDSCVSLLVFGKQIKRKGCFKSLFY